MHVAQGGGGARACWPGVHRRCLLQWRLAGTGSSCLCARPHASSLPSPPLPAQPHARTHAHVRTLQELIAGSLKAPDGAALQNVLSKLNEEESRRGCRRGGGLSALSLRWRTGAGVAARRGGAGSTVLGRVAGVRCACRVLSVAGGGGRGGGSVHGVRIRRAGRARTLAAVAPCHAVYEAGRAGATRQEQWWQGGGSTAAALLAATGGGGTGGAAAAAGKRKRFAPEETNKENEQR